MNEQLVQIVRAVFCSQGRVLLILENFPDGGGNYWIPPGGKVEVGKGESEFRAIHRELLEELGLSRLSLQSMGAELRPYCFLTGPGFKGSKLEVQHFICLIEKPFEPKLLDRQLEARWVSEPPSGGIVGEITMALFARLRSDGYLK